MKPVFFAPKGAIDRKPPHGQPCNGCGVCCFASLCDLGQFVFRRDELPGPCPALQRDALDEHKYVCGLVASPMRYDAVRTMTNGVDAMSKAAALLVGSGTGCDARFNGEPADEAFYEKLSQNDIAVRSKVADAKRKWGHR